MMSARSAWGVENVMMSFWRRRSSLPFFVHHPQSSYSTPPIDHHKMTSTHCPIIRRVIMILRAIFSISISHYFAVELRFDVEFFFSLSVFTSQWTWRRSSQGNWNCSAPRVDKWNRAQEQKLLWQSHYDRDKEKKEVFYAVLVESSFNCLTWFACQISTHFTEDEYWEVWMMKRLKMRFDE